MKKIIASVVTTTLMFGLGAGIFAAQNIYATEIQPRVAEGETEEQEVPEIKTSITLSPASKTLQLSSKSTYDDTISVTNDGTNEITVQVYATPYSYVYSEEEDTYKLGYSFENSFTQISRWIKIKNANGVYETSPSFQLQPGEKRDIKYKITTPDSIPAGGQYAVIFAQVRSNSASGAIKADPGLGMIIYGHSTEGETKISSEIRNMTLEQGVKNTNAPEENKKEVIYGKAKVKNTGNVDFFARAVLKVEPIIGFSSYITPSEKGVVSIIPETELTLTDEWPDIPWFGIYRATWTVTGSGSEPEVIEKIMFFCNPVAIILIIILLTIIIMSIIIVVKRRKARRSRLAI